MTYLSLFSGIGGFELGIQQAHEAYIECKHLGKESEPKERKKRRIGATIEQRKGLCGHQFRPMWNVILPLVSEERNI